MDVQDTVQTDEGQVEQTEAQIQEEQVAGETPEIPESKPEEPDWFTKRIGKLTAEKYALKEQLKAEREKNKGLTQKPVAPNPMQYDDGYGNIDGAKWNQAMENWHNEMENYKRSTVVQEEDDPDRVENLSRFKQQASDIMRTNPDFMEVTNKQIFDAKLLEAIYDQQNSAQLTYYLGKNEGEAFRLNTLPYDQMVTELAMIDRKLNTNGKSISSAPPPIRPVDDSKVIPDVDKSKLSDEEWFQRDRKKRLDDIKKSVEYNG